MIRRVFALALLATTAALCAGCGSKAPDSGVMNGPPAGGPNARIVAAPTPPPPPPGGAALPVVKGQRRR
jgi:hypothetical protein